MIINESNMGELNKVINAFTVYKFIKMIIVPFNKMDAYRYGIIDKHGKFLRKLDTITDAKERKSVDAFHRLIINIKKIIAKVPDPALKAQLTTLPTAMLLLKDEAEKVGADGEVVLCEIKRYLSEEKNINVDGVALNAAFETLLEKTDNGQ
jgi:hypothetical protein